MRVDNRIENQSWNEHDESLIREWNISDRWGATLPSLHIIQVVQIIRMWEEWEQMLGRMGNRRIQFISTEGEETSHKGRSTAQRREEGPGAGALESEVRGGSQTPPSPPFPCPTSVCSVLIFPRLSCKNWSIFSVTLSCNIWISYDVNKPLPCSVRALLSPSSFLPDQSRLTGYGAWRATSPLLWESSPHRPMLPT